MSISQVEALLKEASVEYIKEGNNRSEVAYYATLLREMQWEQTERWLNDAQERL